MIKKEIELFKFEELTEAAKKMAIENLKNEAVHKATVSDMDDACRTADTFKEIAKVSCEIDFSSQGHYVKSVRHTEIYWDEKYPEDQELWIRLYRKVYNRESRLWTDEIMRDVITKWEYDERRSYENNVAWAIAKFFDEIYLLTCKYDSDEYVEAYIISNDFYFLNSGRRYDYM